MLSGWWNGGGAAAADACDEEVVQEVVSADQIVAKRQNGELPRVISGVIEDLSGQTLVLRRGPGEVEVFSLRDVSRVEFHKSPEFDEGSRKLNAHQVLEAIPLLRTASLMEPRKWVIREINAELARALVHAQKFDEALKTIETVMESDPGTRHVTELPLVWDERLPESARIRMDLSELKARSEVRRFVAASANLHEASSRENCIAVLRTLQKSSNSTTQVLAESQLWRVKLLDSDQLDSSDVQMWHRQLQRLDRRTRSGPEFLCGRAHLLLNEYDHAATSLMWMPLVEPLSPDLCRASLNHAAAALELAGRRREAASARSLASLIPLIP